MSNNISRRAFLKCVGVSAAAVGAAGMLSGCKTRGNSTVVEVKVGDSVKNWNNLGVQLSSVFHLTRDPDQPGYEYPVPPLTNVDANFQAMAAATPDFTASCDGQSVLCSANISLYNPNSQSFSDAESLPPQGSGYVVLMLMVPTGWQQIQVTYLPTFVQDKTLTFILNAADVIRG